MNSPKLLPCPETVAAILREMRDDADTIVGGRVITRRNFVPQERVAEWADRIEAASQREREARAPKPDPNWKDICARCNDGDIEPRFCKYYGEPNGCNSPIYGEHPTNEKSAGNAAEEGGAE